MAYKRTSHLNLTPVVNGYTALYVPPVVADYAQTSQFTLTQQYDRRPDILAFELYGEARFWWIFAIYNKNQIVDPINDFTMGKTILVPTRNFVAGI